MTQTGSRSLPEEGGSPPLSEGSPAVGPGRAVEPGQTLDLSNEMPRDIASEGILIEAGVGLDGVNGKVGLSFRSGLLPCAELLTLGAFSALAGLTTWLICYLAEAETNTTLIAPAAVGFAAFLLGWLYLSRASRR